MAAYVGVFDCGIDARLLAVARHPLAADDARPVLAAHGPVVDRVRRERADRLQDLDLLRADGVRLERGRRLHRGQREQLHAGGSGTCRGRRRRARRSRRGARRRPTPRPRSGRGRRSGGSTSARRCRWRSAARRCSGRSPSRGSGRSGRSASRGTPRASSRSAARHDARSCPNGFSTTARDPSVVDAGEPDSPTCAHDRLVGGRAASRSRRSGCGARRGAPRIAWSHSPRRGVERRVAEVPREVRADVGHLAGPPLRRRRELAGAALEVRAELLVRVLGAADADDREVRERSRRRGSGARSPGRGGGASGRRRRRR